MEFAVGPVVVEADGPVVLGVRQLAVLAVLIAAGRPITVDAGRSPGMGETADHRTVASRRALRAHIRTCAAWSAIRHRARRGRDITWCCRRTTRSTPRGSVGGRHRRQLAANQPGDNAADRLPGVARLAGRGVRGPAWRSWPPRSLGCELHAEAEIGRFELALRAGGQLPIDGVESLCRRARSTNGRGAVLIRSQYLAGRQSRTSRTYARVRRRSARSRDRAVAQRRECTRGTDPLRHESATADLTQQFAPLDPPVFLTTFVVGRRAAADSSTALLTTHSNIVTITGPAVPARHGSRSSRGPSMPSATPTACCSPILPSSPTPTVGDHRSLRRPAGRPPRPGIRPPGRRPPLARSAAGARQLRAPPCRGRRGRVLCSKAYQGHDPRHQPFSGPVAPARCVFVGELRPSAGPPDADRPGG